MSERIVDATSLESKENFNRIADFLDRIGQETHAMMLRVETDKAADLIEYLSAQLADVSKQYVDMKTYADQCDRKIADLTKANQVLEKLAKQSAVIQMKLAEEAISTGITGEHAALIRAEKAEQRVAALEERLELYGTDNNGKRVRLPDHYDGIACRDETIRQLEKQLDAIGKPPPAGEEPSSQK